MGHIDDVQEIIWIDAKLSYGKPRQIVFFKPAIGGYEADYLMGLLPANYGVPSVSHAVIGKWGVYIASHDIDAPAFQPEVLATRL